MGKILSTSVAPFGAGQPLAGMREVDPDHPAFPHYVRVFASSVGVFGIEDAAGMVVGILPDGRWAAVSKELRTYRIAFEVRVGEHASQSAPSRAPTVVINPPKDREMLKRLEQGLTPPPIHRDWLHVKMEEGLRLSAEIAAALERETNTSRDAGSGPAVT